MALTDRKDGAVPPTRRRAVTAKGKHWSDSQKLEAVALYLTLGNVALTAATLKIPEITLRYWRKSDWWKEAEAELKIQDHIQLSASAKKIIEKSMTAVMDRLENGDWIYDQKSGELRRKPVAMKDALSAVNSMIEKKMLLDKTEHREESTERIEDKLNKLMDRFSELAEGKKQPVQVTDVIYAGTNSEENDEDALHEERSEGLQT